MDHLLPIGSELSGPLLHQPSIGGDIQAMLCDLGIDPQYVSWRPGEDISILYQEANELDLFFFQKLRSNSHGLIPLAFVEGDFQ